MDWLAKAIGLPPVFYHCNKDTLGGGVIQVNLPIFLPDQKVMFLPRFVGRLGGLLVLVFAEIICHIRRPTAVLSSSITVAVF